MGVMVDVGEVETRCRWPAGTGPGHEVAALVMVVEVKVGVPQMLLW
jgi:hypothetical protein